MILSEMWFNYLKIIEILCENTMYEKKQTLKKKFNKLSEKQKCVLKFSGRKEFEVKDDLKFSERKEIEVKDDHFEHVINMTNISFTNQQLNVLNKGLKFKIPPKKVPIDDIVVNIESKLNCMDLNQHEKAVIRQDCLISIRDNMKSRKNPSSNELKTIKELKDKNVYYVNFDKGEGVVILNKDDYDQKMLQSINEGPFKEMKIDGRWKNNSPLNKMTTDVKNVLNDLCKNFDLSEYQKRSLTISNPKIPIVYGSIKVHKPDKKMRLIVRYTNSPTEKISKWVVKEFNKLNYPKGNFIKNSIEFVKKMENIEINEDEIMVKFDVKSMFPSIPLDIALTQVKQFLDTRNITDQKKKILFNLLSLCMKQRTFQFRDKFYEQTSGATIGNAASPLVADFTMDYFEKKIKFKRWCPRIFFRYVDDYFTIIKKCQVNEILQLMNNQINSIEFTMETEEDNKISYLDLLLERKGRKIEFDIYRKESNTGLLIQKDSYHHQSHQAAAFHSMIHRLLSIPMTKENYEKELISIEDIAEKNGYNKKYIERILKKHKKKINLGEITKLVSLTKEDPLNYISIPFSGEISLSLQKTLKKHKIGLAHKNNGKLSDLLQNPKDVDRNILHQSGVYLLKCEEPSCDCIYIGETRRRFITRYEEHVNDTLKPPNQESAMAYHAINNNHEIAFFEALKTTQDPHKLKAYESLHLYLKRNENLLNTIRQGNLPSVLYNLVEEQNFNQNLRSLSNNQN